MNACWTLFEWWVQREGSGEPKWMCGEPRKNGKVLVEHFRDCMLLFNKFSVTNLTKWLMWHTFLGYNDSWASDDIYSITRFLFLNHCVYVNMTFCVCIFEYDVLFLKHKDSTGSCYMWGEWTGGRHHNRSGPKLLQSG